MNLRFYNSFSREMEDLRPRKARHLGIYVCGPTVYAAPHLGHARSAVIFDVFRRFWEAVGYDVTLVRNITDIDDKILRRAREAGLDYRRVAERYGREYDTAMAALNVRPPHAAPRATDYVGACQAVIARILQRGHAYRRGGSIYFSSHSLGDSGPIAWQPEADARPVNSGPPVDVDKRHPHDFALWKGRQNGDPFWESPWGPGRPGWHIECTAMSHTLLDIPFDIHGGGCDLRFPHHANEILQSRAAFGQPPADIWLHHGMVTVGHVKMAKSKGNAPPLEDLLAAYHPEAVRLFLLSRHYRRDLPFSANALGQAARQLDRFYTLAGRLQAWMGACDPSAPCGSRLWQRFSGQLALDGNVPGGLAVVFETMREINRALDAAGPMRCSTFRRTVADTATDFIYLARHVLGLLQTPLEDYRRLPPSTCAPELPRPVVERLVARRQSARQAGDWRTADRLRRRLEEDGVRLRDHDHATVWRQGKRKGRVTSAKTSS